MRPVSLFNLLFALIADRLATRRAIADLNALTDAQLRDLGINRADIPTAVAGGLTRGVAFAFNDNHLSTMADRRAA